MNRIENAGQVKTGYSVKSGTNSEEKVGNGSDFASMLTKYKKKAAQDDETKKAETAPALARGRVFLYNKKAPRRKGRALCGQ